MESGVEKKRVFQRKSSKKSKGNSAELGRRCIPSQSDNDTLISDTLILRRKDAPGVMTITLHNKDRIYICI